MIGLTSTMVPEIKAIGAETRIRCFLNCGKKQESGDRALAIQTDHPAKQWKCHQYGCTKLGNILSLCDLLKPGANHGGRPRGERFKEIAADIEAMVAGVLRAETPATPAQTKPEPAKVNVPLKDSENERARGLL